MRVTLCVIADYFHVREDGAYDVIGARQRIEFGARPPDYGFFQIVYGLEREPDEAAGPRATEIRVVDPDGLVIFSNADVMTQVSAMTLKRTVLPATTFKKHGRHEIHVIIDNRIASVQRVFIGFPAPPRGQ